MIMRSRANSPSMLREISAAPTPTIAKEITGVCLVHRDSIRPRQLRTMEVQLQSSTVTLLENPWLTFRTNSCLKSVNKLRCRIHPNTSDLHLSSAHVFFWIQCEDCEA